jgi:erythrocyte band 7 integral membrane protein
MATKEEEPVVRVSPTTGPREAPTNEAEAASLGAGGMVCAAFSVMFIIVFFPLSLFWTIKIVKEYERAVIFRLGRITSKRAKGPGLFFVLPCVDTVQKVDLRIVTIDIPPQEILTKDSVTARVDGVVYFRVFNPTWAKVRVDNYYGSTYLIAQTTLRNILGTKTLAQLLTDRDSIADQMERELDEATDPWGIKVLRVEIKDVRIPNDLRRAMAAEAEASRESRAKVIAAEGEQNASSILREAADVFDEAPGSLQLRYLQTLNTISGSNNHTYVFPLPLDLLSKFFAK